MGRRNKIVKKGIDLGKALQITFKKFVCFMYLESQDRSQENYEGNSEEKDMNEVQIF